MAERDASQLKTLLETISGEEAATLVRRPSSTVAPPHDLKLGKKAFEVLKTLAHDPRGLVDEAQLGEGGMGVVRLARQVALDRHVAVKALKPTLRAQHDVEALLAEAWLTGGLEHPNILPVYSLSLDAAGLPVLVMKRIEGVTWGQLIRDPGLMAKHAPDRAPLDEHLRILGQVCNAVHFAHARGVVHRDLKPDNVMVGAFGEVYVVDWGIATAFGPATQLAGTPAYMAPEMLGTPGAMLTAKTDVYLLGAMLFEVLVGRAPHQATSPRDLFDVVLRSEPNLPDSAPPELAALVRKSMRAAPDLRPESALEFRRALEAFDQHQGSNALAEQSMLRATELRELTTAAQPDRKRIDALFSECRFGLRMALNGWAGNERARNALDGVLEDMVRFELAKGSARAAQLLVSEFDCPAPLRAELDAALAREADKDVKLKRLASLEVQLDPRTGSRTRTVVAIAIGLIWILAPLIGQAFGVTPRQELVATVPLTLFTGALLITLRIKALFRPANWTPLNQQLLDAVLFANIVQSIVVVVLYLGDVDLGVYGHAILAAYWAFLSGLIAVTLLRSVWITTVGYLVAAAVSWRWPELRMWATMFASLVLCLNALVLVKHLPDTRVGRP